MCKHDEVVVYVGKGKKSVAVCQKCGQERKADRIEDLKDFLPTVEEMKGVTDSPFCSAAHCRQMCEVCGKLPVRFLTKAPLT